MSLFRSNGKDAESPEDQLCLLLARRHLSPQIERRAREILATPLKWDMLWGRGAELQILPLVCHNLQAMGLAGVPRRYRHKLTTLLTVNQLRTEFLTRETVYLLRLF